MRLATGVLAAVVLLTAAAARACTGDCSGDRAVTVDELLLGVTTALGGASVAECPPFDRDESGDVTVDELLEAVANALTGCPPEPSATATATPTSTPTQTLDATPTATATATVNSPPLAPTPSVYRGFAGHPIDFLVGATDPDGPLTYTAVDLPAGATLDSDSGRFTWTPEPDQFGAYYVPWSAHDQGAPPLAVGGRLTFLIEPVDSCSIVSCDPATGCDSDLPGVESTCCSGQVPHVAEPGADCPGGRVAIIGQNDNGFGQLANCDLFQVVNQAQSGAEIEFNVKARCINIASSVKVRARLDMNRPARGGPTALLDEERRVTFTAGADGYALRRSVRFAVDVPGPFFDFQDAEANLYVELRDGDANLVTQSVRVRLTFTPIPDVADPSPVPTPTPTGPS